MEKENNQLQAAAGMKGLCQEFEAAAAYARSNKGKALRSWFTGETLRQDEAAYLSYAKRLREAQALFSSAEAGDGKKARAVLTKLKREFRAVAKANRALPPPGMGAMTLATHPAPTLAANPKAAQFDAYAGRVNSILRLMK